MTVEEEIKQIKSDIAFLKKAAVVTGKLCVRTDTDVEALKAQKRMALFVHRSKKKALAAKWNSYKKARDESFEKAQNEEGAAKTEMKDEPEDKSKPHWGTSVFLAVTESLKELLTEWAKPDSGKSQMIIQGLQMTLSEVFAKDPGRVVKYAFPHTDMPEEEDKAWAWTLQFYDNDTADSVRESFLYELQHLMKKQEVSLKQDNPSAEGGKLRKEVRELLKLPAPKKKPTGNKKKRSAGPATPMKEGDGAKR